MRKIRPRTEYAGDRGYPALVPVDDGVSRRGFFSRAAGTAVAVVTGGGIVAAVQREVRGAPRPGEQKVTVRFPYGTRIPGSGYRGDRVEVWTRDKRLARFLRSSKERSGLGKALAGPVAKAKADALYDGRKLYQLERQLGRALARRYQQRTGHRARAPDLMLRIRPIYSGIRTGGVVVRPSIRIKPRPQPRRSP